MNNLLPSQQKKSNKREYTVRCLSLSMFLLSGVLAVFVLLSIPSHILLSSWPDNIKKAASSARVTVDNYDELSEEVEAANALVGHLDEWEPERRFSEMIDILDEASGSNITISQFNFGEKNSLFTVVGNAATRADLSAFRNRLEENDKFRSIELPISNLAEDTDLSFTMTIKFPIKNDE